MVLTLYAIAELNKAEGYLGHLSNNNANDGKDLDKDEQLDNSNEVDIGLDDSCNFDLEGNHQLDADLQDQNNSSAEMLVSKHNSPRQHQAYQMWTQRLTMTTTLILATARTMRWRIRQIF